MNICICHDAELQKYLTSKGMKHQASGITPNKKTRYWVYTETQAYIQLVNEFNRKEEK